MDTPALASELRVVISGLHKSMRRQMSPISSYSMTEVETIGLLCKTTSLLPSELATMTRVKTQTMSQILKKLEEQGIITRTPAQDDKRKVYVAITTVGKKMVDKTRNERDEWLKQQLEEILTEKEKELLARAVPVLEKLMTIK